MNATEYCLVVENRLGWVPPQTKPIWAKYQAEAGKVKRKIATNPELYTWENLLLAVELLVRERQPRTPIGVFAHVERALDLALDKATDVEAEIQEIVAYESGLGDPAGWVVRFARAQGGYRQLLVDEWKQAVR
jgi:hypothetical protein